jgi:hypothetical protein
MLVQRLWRNETCMFWGLMDISCLRKVRLLRGNAFEHLTKLDLAMLWTFVLSQSKAWSIQICEYCLLYGDNQIFILLEKGKFSWLETWACNQGLVQVSELIQREHPKLDRARWGTILPREDECTRSNEKFSIGCLWVWKYHHKGQ